MREVGKGVDRENRGNRWSLNFVFHALLRYWGPHAFTHMALKSHSNMLPLKNDRCLFQMQVRKLSDSVRDQN